MEIWYGKDFFNKDIEITDFDLLNFLNSMSKIENVEGHDSNMFKSLFEHALKEDFITLHDGSRLVRRCLAAKEQNWNDIYDLLSETIKNQ